MMNHAAPTTPRVKRPLLASLAFLTVLGSTAFGMQRSPQEAKPRPLLGQGALELLDGRRIPGTLERNGERLTLKRGARKLQFRRTAVRRFIPVASLDAQLDKLAVKANTAFGRAQVGIRAFEIGHPERGFAELSKLLDEGATPPSRARLEELAAQELRAGLSPRSQPALGKQFLLSLTARGGSPKQRLTRAIAWRVLRNMLAVEVQQRNSRQKAERETRRSYKPRNQKGSKTLAAVCRKFAAEALHSARRQVARAALLAHDTASQHFVYRQAIAWPRGSTSRRIARELRSLGHADRAASYLAHWLGKPRRVLERRAVQVLGELGSAEGLAPLRALAKSLPARIKARKAAAGAGSGHRANISFTTEQAYVADYDVEIATAAAIAKPIVRSARSGVVLDATVGGIHIDRYEYELGSDIRSSLRAIRAALKND